MEPPPESELEILTYEDFGVGIRWIAQQVVDDDWIPDAILGVVRGGLFVAAGIAYALDIKDVRHVNIEFYTDAGVTLPEPILIGDQPHLLDLVHRRVLVADDVADTGATLHFLRKLLPADSDVRVAVLYEKPHTTYAPEIAWRSTDKWIRFPWIQVPPVRVAEEGRSSV
ncbi:MAG: phosphoribosyltransferase [Actinobacteria bacterium]|nr:phosphoribosyltransferase [Actinomycetota bacterium]